MRCQFVLITLSIIGACGPAVSNDSLPARYAAAACIPFASVPTITPHTRQWNHNVTLRSGASIRINGAQIPGGKVDVSYTVEHSNVRAADPGDYVYPTDVRFDARNELLYTKANGLAGGLTEQTWFFEFDLRQRRITKRLQVRNGTPPAECREGPATH